MAKRILKLFAFIERPAAWVLLIGGFCTFVSVLVGLITVGNAKLATLLIAADLIVGGFSAVQTAEDDESPTRSSRAPSKRPAGSDHQA